MKKQLFILGTLLLLIIASSCSKDDKNADPIVGTWEIRENHENYKLYNRFTFNSNQTGEYYYTEAEKGEEIDENNQEDLEQFTYSINKDELFITHSITEYEPEYIHNEVTDKYEYSISDNKLTISYEVELYYTKQKVYTRKN